MDLAEDSEVLCHVPAVLILATLDSCLTRHVLPPVHALIRLDLLTYRLLEVFVADLSVSIRIKVVEKLLELLF